MRIGNRTLHTKRFDSFSKKTENLLVCKVRFPMRRQPEIAIFILFRRLDGETLRGFFA